MIFEYRDGTTAEVKERTWAQIYKTLKSYMTDKEIDEYSYINGSQFISEMNGNIYAKFLCKATGEQHTFYVFDYKEYINEVL